MLSKGLGLSRDRDHKLRLIQGGNAPSKSRKRWSFDKDKLEDWNCPVCLKEDGERWNEVAVTYLGAVHNCSSITLQHAKRGEVLICTRCYREDRLGMFGERGAIACREPGKGWLFIV